MYLTHFYVKDTLILCPARQNVGTVESHVADYQRIIGEDCPQGRL
jgi:hypothetical protein